MNEAKNTPKTAARLLILDLGVVAGAALFLRGLYLIWHPLLFLAGGILLVGGCFLLGYERGPRGDSE